MGSIALFVRQFLAIVVTANLIGAGVAPQAPAVIGTPPVRLRKPNSLPPPDLGRVKNGGAQSATLAINPQLEVEPGLSTKSRRHVSAQIRTDTPKPPAKRVPKQLSAKTPFAGQVAGLGPRGLISSDSWGAACS